MPIIYEKSDASVQQAVEKVKRAFHPDLLESKAKISLLMASAEPGKDAVKLHGVKCAAVVRIVPYKQRVDGRADAEIVFDADYWELATEESRESLVDHELHHLLVQREKSGAVKTDDCGRPKFKMRPHDHDFGWFDVIARRHRDASEEIRQAKSFADEFGQIYFGWVKPPTGEVEAGPTPSVPDEEVTGRKSRRNVTTADGRKITPDEMMDEIKGSFARE